MNADKSIFWEGRFKAAQWLIPILLLGAAAHFGILPMAAKLRALEQEIRKGEQNVYETNWLDSVKTSLSQQNDEIEGFLREIQKRTFHFSSLQSVSDDVRQLLSGCGLDVLKIRTEHQDAGGLKKLLVRADGITDYASLISLFQKISHKYPRFSIERMTVRKSRRGLNFAISITAYATTGR